jgi:ABC-type cobalamin/Fe3+-siderophores transport system ATPase subunit
MENKLSGIIAKNNCGKSSLIDILLYTLYTICISGLKRHQSPPFYTKNTAIIILIIRK